MPKTLRQILSTLPDNLKKAYYSENTSEAIKDAVVLSQAPLSSEQIIIIENEVNNVLLGREPVFAFKDNLKQRLNIPDTNLEILNKVIQEKIFNPLQEDLNELEINKPQFVFNKIPLQNPQSPQKPSSLFTTKPPVFPQENSVPNKESLSPINTINAQTISSNPSQPFDNLSSTKEPLSSAKPEIPIKPFASATTSSSPSPFQELPKTEPPKTHFPEVQEIKIERPISNTQELKKVMPPDVTPEEQQKIHSRLLEAIKKKAPQSPILDALKKAMEIKQNPKNAKINQTSLKQEKPVSQETSIGMSQIVAGESKDFTIPKTNESPKKPKPYILNVNLKEEKREENQILPKEEIKYQKPTTKPFGEA